MNCLDWMELYDVFYRFAAKASKHHFYDEERARMERSLWEMRPPELQDGGEGKDIRKDDKNEGTH